jgi:hypothetical protein
MYTYGISIDLLDRLLQTTNNHYMQIIEAESGIPQIQHTVHKRDYFTIYDPQIVEILLETESQLYNAYREQGQWKHSRPYIAQYVRTYLPMIRHFYTMGVRLLNFELFSDAYPTFDVSTVLYRDSDLNLIARDFDQYLRELLMFRHHVHMIDQKCKDNQRVEDAQLQMLTELQILSKMEIKVTKSGRHTTPPVMFDDTSSPGFVASQWIPNSFEGGAHHIEPSRLLQQAVDENPYRVLDDESSSATPNLAS